VGWEGTRKKFEGLIAAAAELSIAQVEGPHIQVSAERFAHHLREV
jgi:hypothetical protein